MKPKNLKILSAFLVVAVVIVFGVVLSQSDAPNRYESDASEGDIGERFANFCVAEYNACKDRCYEIPGIGEEIQACKSVCQASYRRCLDALNPPTGDDPKGPELPNIDPKDDILMP